MINFAPNASVSKHSSLDIIITVENQFVSQDLLWGIECIAGELAAVRHYDYIYSYPSLWTVGLFPRPLLYN